MDNKPLLQERPPAYSPAAQGAGYDYGQSNYGAIPAPQPGFQPPPPYPYPGAAAAAGVLERLEQDMLFLHRHHSQTIRAHTPLFNSLLPPLL